MTKQGGWPPSGFGGRLKAVREGAGLSQSQLAGRAGCNLFTISKIERGLHEPAWPLVQALARALSVTCAAFEVPEGEAVAPPEPQSRGRPRKADAETPGKAGELPRPQKKPARGKRPKPRHG
jgi:transcriptional regulator with XRE-family HTH domain